MRIGIVIFSLLIAFMIGINFYKNNIISKNDNVKVKIESWQIKNNNLLLELSYITDTPLFFKKEIICKTFDKNKEELSIIQSYIETDLADSKRELVSIGKADTKVKYIDCSFIKN